MFFPNEHQCPKLPAPIPCKKIQYTTQIANGMSQPRTGREAGAGNHLAPAHLGRVTSFFKRILRIGGTAFRKDGTGVGVGEKERFRLSTSAPSGHFASCKQSSPTDAPRPCLNLIPKASSTSKVLTQRHRAGDGGNPSSWSGTNHSVASTTMAANKNNNKVGLCRRSSTSSVVTSDYDLALVSSRSADGSVRSLSISGSAGVLYAAQSFSTGGTGRSSPAPAQPSSTSQATIFAQRRSLTIRSPATTTTAISTSTVATDTTAASAFKAKSPRSRDLQLLKRRRSSRATSSDRIPFGRGNSQRSNDGGGGGGWALAMVQAKRALEAERQQEKSGVTCTGKRCAMREESDDGGTFAKHQRNHHLPRRASCGPTLGSVVERYKDANSRSSIPLLPCSLREKTLLETV